MRSRGRERKRDWRECRRGGEGEGESREGGGQGGGEGGDAEDRRSLHCRRTDPTHVRIPVGRTDAAVGSRRNRGTRCTGSPRARMDFHRALFVVSGSALDLDASVSFFDQSEWRE